MVEDNRSQKQVELELEVLQACRETAKSFRGSVKENANRRNIRLHVISSNPIEHEKLRAIITADSSLGSCRFNSLGEYVPDGFTPLHLAASLGNNSTLSILLECPGVSAWCRDLQGRTPLHIAVKHGKVDTCELLRKRMEEERYDPVGVNAPVDLTGNTPLGWAGMGTSCPNLPLFMPARLQTGPITPHTTPVRNAIRAALDATPERTPPPAASSTTPLANPTFLLGIGDSSILPRSPLVERGGGTATGLSPLNSSINTNTSISRPRPPIPPVGTSITEDPVASLTDALASACSVSYSSFASTTLPTETSDLPMVVYGFGEASGWRPYMEDRIVHGALSHFLTNAATGSATSATSTVTATLSGAEGLTESYVFGILDGHGGDFSVNHVSKHLPSHLATGFSTVSANRNLSIDVLEETMISSFLQVDAQLGSLGRMQPQTSNKGVVTYLDESGSTGCVCVVTPEHIICGNVGDSRAVLGSICGVVDQQDIGLGQSQDAMHTPAKLRPVSAAATAGPGFPAHMLCRRFEARDLSTDHKPEIPSECMRIEAAGGGVHCVREGVYEVFVGLDKDGKPNSRRVRMSRAFGDFYYKQNKDLSQREQVICALPEVTVCDRSSGSILIVACDGVWDVLSSQEAIDFVYNALLEEYSSLEYAEQHRTAWDPTLLPRVVDSLLQVCVERNSQDNLSAIVVLLDSPVSLLLRS